MELVADVGARVVERVEDRLPALGELLEGRLNKSLWTLRIGIDIRPCECAGKRRMGLEPKVLRRLGRHHQLLDRPFLPLGRLAVDLFRRDGVEGVVISRVYGDELAVQMACKLGNR